MEVLVICSAVITVLATAFAFVRASAENRRDAERLEDVLEPSPLDVQILATFDWLR